MLKRDCPETEHDTFLQSGCNRHDLFRLSGQRTISFNRREMFIMWAFDDRLFPSVRIALISEEQKVHIETGRLFLSM